MSKRILALTSLTLLLLGSVASAHPVEQKAAAAKKLAASLRGLSTTPLGTVALWRNRTLRSPETTKSIKTIAAYVKAEAVNRGGQRAYTLRGTNLIITVSGAVRERALMPYGSIPHRAVTPKTVAGLKGEQILDELHDTARRIDRGEDVNTELLR